MKTERIDTESRTNHENGTNQERRPKIENPSLDPPTVEIRNDTPTVENDPTEEISP